MPDYYFDIETYAKGDKPDLKNDPVIAITYQKIDSRSGQPKEDLQILKSWESSEEDILKRFYDIFKPEDNWAFIPVGFNLTFDITSLMLRWQTVGITVGARYFSNHPYIDLKHLGLLCNHGMFKGSSLEKLAGKKQSGDKIVDLYEAGDYDSITGYIEDEAFTFLRFYQYFVTKLPEVWQEFAEATGIKTGEER